MPSDGADGLRVDRGLVMFDTNVWMHYLPLIRDWVEHVLRPGAGAVMLLVAKVSAFFDFFLKLSLVSNLCVRCSVFCCFGHFEPGLPARRPHV